MNNEREGLATVHYKITGMGVTADRMDNMNLSHDPRWR